MRSTPRREAEMTQTPLLRIRDLSVSYSSRGGVTRALDGLSLDLDPGEFLGIVGESGSGKTQLLLAMLGLNAQGARLTGSIRYRDRELVGANAAVLAPLRGRRIGMIFQ